MRFPLKSMTHLNTDMSKIKKSETKKIIFDYQVTSLTTIYSSFLLVSSLITCLMSDTRHNKTQLDVPGPVHVGSEIRTTLILVQSEPELNSAEQSTPLPRALVLKPPTNPPPDIKAGGVGFMGRGCVGLLCLWVQRSFQVCP